ncbi:MAG: N-acetyltransferase family protein [Aliidongia sp.]
MSVTPLPVLVRASTDADVPAMLAIYRHHIAHGIGDLGGYEAEPLEADDLRRRRKNMRNHRLPHLVAQIEGIVAGYAYTVPFRKRPAYRYALKHSIYIHPHFVNCGVGRTLLPALMDASAAAGYRQMIGYIDPANQASLRLHETLGFARVGLLPAVAYKFGHWVDSVMVQRALGPGATTPPGNWEQAAAPSPGETPPPDAGPPV